MLLIQERGDRNLLMNPDYEERFIKASDVLTREKSIECLEKMDRALYALQKNLNLKLLLIPLLSGGQ